MDAVCARRYLYPDWPISCRWQLPDSEMVNSDPTSFARFLFNVMDSCPDRNSYGDYGQIREWLRAVTHI